MTQLKKELSRGKRKAFNKSVFHFGCKYAVKRTSFQKLLYCLQQHIVRRTPQGQSSCDFLLNRSTSRQNSHSLFVVVVVVCFIVYSVFIRHRKHNKQLQTNMPLLTTGICERMGIGCMTKYCECFYLLLILQKPINSASINSIWKVREAFSQS